jgi:SH3-like domain-containing protein
MTGQRQASDQSIMSRINAETTPISTAFSNAPEFFQKRRRAFFAALVWAVFCATHAAAQEPQKGPVSGLPLPRYVSLKSDRVNVREGPSKEHPTLWIYERAALPVEITAEFETWRKIRDSEGAEGWVLHSLLSGRRTALVAPWKKEPQLLVAADHSTPMAKLGPGVIGNLRSCDGKWCRIAGKGFDGYMEQENLWGVYPGEKFE